MKSADEYMGQWVQVVHRDGSVEIGRVVDAYRNWSTNGHSDWGLYWTIEFARPFLWFFKLKHLESYHNKYVFFLPLLEQLAMEGK